MRAARRETAALEVARAVKRRRAGASRHVCVDVTLGVVGKVCHRRVTLSSVVSRAYGRFGGVGALRAVSRRSLQVRWCGRVGRGASMSMRACI